MHIFLEIPLPVSVRLFVRKFTIPNKPPRVEILSLRVVPPNFPLYLWVVTGKKGTEGSKCHY